MNRLLRVDMAIREGLLEELRRNEKLFLLGPDIDLPEGAPGITAGFSAEFGPKRIRSTPLSEAAVCGMAVGAALRGLHPCVTLREGACLPLCADALENQAAKSAYLSGGRCAVPLVLRLPLGTAPSPEGAVCRVPGLKVAAPCSAADARGLLKSALRDMGPVVFFEHSLLYDREEEIPETETLVPLGCACVRRPGRDVTIIAWSRSVHLSLEAAGTLSDRGIDAEVLDLRSLVPLDWDAVCQSVSKTHNVVIVSQEAKRGSYAGELSAQIAEELFDQLDAPVERVCARNTAAPFSPALAERICPRPDDIASAVARVLNR